MKNIIKKLCVFMLITSMMLTSVMPVGYAAYGLPDGRTAVEGDGRKTKDILDFDDMSMITKNNFVADNQHTLDGKYSAYWNHNTTTNVDLKSIPNGDWSEYYQIDMSIYAKNAGGTQFVLVAFCETGGYFYNTVTLEEGQHDYSLQFGSMKTSGSPSWGNISYVRITSSGWSMSPSYNSEYWFNSFKLKAVEEGIARIYPTVDVDAAYAAMDGNIAVYGGGTSVLNSKKVEPYNAIDWTEETTAVPAKLYSDYLGANVNKSDNKVTLSANGKIISLTVGDKKYAVGSESGELAFAPYEKDGNVYVPAAQVGDLLGFQTKSDKRLVIIGDDKVRDFDSYSKVNNMLEVVGYLTYSIDVDPETIPDEEIELAKDRWRYSIVADETLDITDPTIKKIIGELERTGKASWDLLDKFRDSEASLFLGKFPDSSPNMTTEYKNIYNMAVAWAQYGSQYYHNDDLLEDILFALEFQFENRYGYDEIENDPDVVWRDHTLKNWYDWQIDTPRYLIPTLLLVEDYLTQKQKEDYVAFFDYWIKERCYDSMHVDAGMNVLYTVQSWIGSTLLTGRKADLIDAVGCLHNCFAWADTFPTREGFYSDGSYLFHYKHPMTGQYGITQFRLSGPILSVINGTTFDFNNPRKENIFDWLYDAYEPIIFDGAIFRYVKGRAVNASDRGVARNFIQGCLDLLDFAGEDDAARMKSIIKYYIQTEKTISYEDSNITIPQRAKILEILNDDSIQPRDEYYISKTYYNMDKIAHQRGDWAFGVSMSSSRVYDYECIQGENTTGWYTGEGMTQLMIEGDQAQFHSGYWNNVDPYKYPGITVDTQKRDAHTIDTGKAFVKDYDFVGGATIDNTYTTAAQQFNAFNLEEDITQSGGNVIKAHKSTLVGKKSWFLFDDEVVCLGAGINANDGFDVRTIVENRKSNNMASQINEDEVTKKYAIVKVEATQEPQADNPAINSIDEDFGTKWAAEGEAEIVYDIGSVNKIGVVAFSFQNGSKRTQKIDIELSEDGKNWTQKFAGNSSGTTEGLEIFDMNNTPARYVKLRSYGNSAGGLWISLTEAVIYGPYDGAQPQIIAGSYLGTEKVVVNGSVVNLTEEEVTSNDVNWVNLQDVGGYYFPKLQSVTMHRTTGEKSFFELWINHGVSPKNQGYSYVILPTMSVEETSAYAADPGIEILSNTDKLSAVYDKSTGMTGVVFWEAGTFDGITVDKPMIIMYKRTEDGLQIVASDPTHKLIDATITTDTYLSIENAEDVDYRMQIAADGKSIAVKFASSNGESIPGTFKKSSSAPSTDAIEPPSGGGGGSKPDKDTTDGTEGAEGSENAGTSEAVTFKDLSGYEWATDYIKELAESGVIAGKEDGIFAPGDKVTRAEYVKMLVLALGVELGEYDGFSDVKKDDWFYPYVAAAYKSGAVSGIREDYFGADDSISRQDAAVIIYRLLKLTDSISEADFKDLTEIAGYAQKAGSALSEIGIFAGDENGNFMPKKSLTRAEAAKIICLMLETSKK